MEYTPHEHDTLELPDKWVGFPNIILNQKIKTRFSWQTQNLEFPTQNKFVTHFSRIWKTESKKNLLETIRKLRQVDAINQLSAMKISHHFRS